jgi:hypothetical protein
MNYKNIYNQLIENARKRNSGQDSHHILPKSLYPDLKDDLNNLVMLTHKEHYVAHHLLMKFNRCKETLYAFRLMTQIRTQKITARVFENLKKDFARLVSDTHKGKTVSDETKAKIREKRALQTFSIDTRQKMAAAGKKRVGDKNYMFGKKHKQVSIDKMIIARSGINHYSVIGHYVTPWGKFITAELAAAASKHTINLTSLRRWCCSNTDKKIRKQSYQQSPYLNTFDDSIIGKTFKDIGFWYELRT